MTREQTSSMAQGLVFGILILLLAAPAIADDGRVYQPPLGNSRYVYPFNYHKFKVPQKLGYGFYPTYWRDWHDNPDAVLTELRPNRKPYQKKKKQKPEPAATKPADVEDAATEDDTLPPPPVEPELPPQETPDVPSENLELPSGNLELPSAQPADETTTPPTLEPAPASAPETETPATPTEPEATTPNPDAGEPAPSAKPAADDPLSLPPLEGPPTEQPMSQLDDGPSLYRRPTRKTSIAGAPTRKRPRTLTEEQTLQSLGSKFDSAADTELSTKDEASIESFSTSEDAAETIDQSNIETSGVDAVRAAMQFQPRPKRQPRKNTPTASPIRRATYLDDSVSGGNSQRVPHEQRANTPKRISFGGASPGHMNPLRSSENQHRDRAASAAQYANPLRYNDPENR